MSKEQESLKTEIYGLLKSRGLNPVSKDSSGDTVPIPTEAEVFEFMFSKDGKDYGKVWVTLDGLRQLIVYFGKDVADSPKNGSQDSNSWSQLHRALSRFATGRQLSFELSDQSNLEADMAKREHTKREEQVNEGYYPIGKNASGNNNVPSVTMRIQHTRPIEEGEQRFRNIARIFVENQDGERILLPTTKPGLARTYVRHIAEGGKPNDERWNHLGSLCEEYQKMAGFVRATRNGQFNESAQSLVNEGINHYQKLRETLGKLQGKRGYNEYFESYTPALMEDEEQIDLSEMFMSSSLDPRIESVMPILSKLSRNITETTDMAETIALEEWADSLTELSNEKLGDYKKAAGADASAADKAGDFKRGDKRFKGIVRATVKQGDNDTKKHQEQGVDQRKLDIIKRMHGIISKNREQGMDEGQLDEIGDTPAGRAALQKYQDKAGNQVAAHWKQVHNKSYLPTDPKMAKRNAGTVAAGNRTHGFGIAKNQQDKVTDRFKYRDAVGLSHVYQKNDPLEQGVTEEGEISMDNPGKLSNQEYKDKLNQLHGQPDKNTSWMNKQHQDFYDKNPSFKQAGKSTSTVGDSGRFASTVVPSVTDTKVGRIPMNTPGGSAMRGGGGMGGGGGGSFKRPGDDWRYNMLKLENASDEQGVAEEGNPVPGQNFTTSQGQQMNWNPASKSWQQQAPVPGDDGGFDVVSGYDTDHTIDNGNKSTGTYTSTTIAKNPTTGQQQSLASWDHTDPATGKNYSGSNYIDAQGNAETEKNYQESKTGITSTHEVDVDKGLSRLRELAGVQTHPVQSQNNIQGIDLDDVGARTYPVPNRGNIQGTDLDPTDLDPIGLSPLNQTNVNPHSPVAPVDLTQNSSNDIPAGNKLVRPIKPLEHEIEEGVYDPDYRGGHNNEFDELEDLLSKSGMSQDDLMRQRFLTSKYGLNTPADMVKLPALKKDAEAGYKTRKAEIDTNLEKRNQQYLQDKLTDLEYQQDPGAFVKRRTQQSLPKDAIAPADIAAEPGMDYSLGRAKLGSSPSVKLPNAGFSVDQFSSEPSAKVPAAEPGMDYSLGRAKLGSSPSTKLPNFRPDLSVEVPPASPDSAPTQTNQLDTRNQNSSIFQQLAQLRNRTRGSMTEASHEDAGVNTMLERMKKLSGM